MGTQTAHQGMSYTSSFPQLAETTFIAADNAFPTLCTRENMQTAAQAADGAGQYTQPKQQYSQS